MNTKVLSGTDAFCVALDNLVGLNAIETRRLVWLYALLYDKLVVPDSWTMTNAPLQQVLGTPDGFELMRQGVLVVALRDSMPSFADFLVDCQQKKMTGLCATSGVAQMLDREATAHAVRFPIADVGSNYRLMVRRVFKPEVLMLLGVSESGAGIVNDLMEAAVTNGASWWTNIFVHEELSPKLGLPSDQQLVKDLARAPYNLNLPTLLGSGILCTPAFDGDRVLAAIMHDGASVGSMQVEDGVSVERFSMQVDDPRIGWLLTTGVTDFSTEELCVFRGSTKRDHYLVALQAFFATQNHLTWGSLRVALADYLSDGLDLVVRQRASLAVNEAPAEISADSALHVMAKSQHVELKGLSQSAQASADMHATVTIIGRTLKMPESMP